MVERAWERFGFYIAQELAIIGDSTNRVTGKEVGELASLAATFKYMQDEECESPIELILAAELFFLRSPFGRFASVNPDMHRWATEDDSYGVFWSTQISMPGIPHRADFGIMVKYGRFHEFILIECDGHDYHEKTKEQAARDKKRDRDFTGTGARILRFTGSEIYRAPEKCAAEIRAVALAALTRCVNAWRSANPGRDLPVGYNL